MRLENKVAIVTGAASGLGKEIARAFVSEGARVIVADLDEAGGAALAEELGKQSVFRRLDVTSESDIQGCIADCIDQFGGLNIMVNNAGVTGPWGPIEELDIGGVEVMFRINVSGPLLGTKHAISAMEAAGGGSIINISGTAGESVRGGALQMGYNLAKAAVNQLTRCSAYELGKKNIRVNAIAPGFMASPVLPRTLGISEDRVEDVMPALRNYFETLQPLPVAGDSTDIAEMAVYLASDLTRFVTGQIQTVDGGMVLDYAGLNGEDWLNGLNRALGLSAE